MSNPGITMDSPIYIGVDFGTTNVVVASILTPDDTDPPSVTPTTCISMNYEAKCVLSLDQFPDAALPPSATSQTPPMEITEIKKFLGQTDATAHMINAEGNYGYDLHDLHIRAGGAAARPERIAAEIAKRIVTHHAPDKSKVYAVVTVPAYFNDAQRRATKDALAQAGITVVSLINEPTAAALTYASRIPADSKMLVVDIGGGTTDVSALEKKDGLHVRGTSGDPHVGGQEIDRLLVELILTRKAAFAPKDHKKKKGKAPLTTPKPDANTRAVMMTEARRVKEYLSNHRQCDFRLEAFNGRPLHLEERVTVEQLNAAISATCQQITVHIEGALRLTCEQQYNRMTLYAQDAIRQTQQAVEMFARGDLTANLTPFMVSKFFIPHLVKFKKGRRTRKFFVSHPEMLYKVGTVTLIGADFENLQLDYVLMYPDLDSASVAPYYAIRQVGMIAHHTYDNQTTCVSLDVPNNAVYYDQRWQVLHYPERCRTHGRVILCNTLHFQLKDVHHCLTHANVGGPNCPLLTCDATQDNYISTAAGLLLRTTEDKVTLTHQFGSNQGNRTSPRIKSSIVSPLKVPPSGSVFIEWGDNVTTVAFGTTAIHAPTKISVNSVFGDLLPMVEPLLSLRDTLQIPTLGLDYLATALERYDSAIAQFDADRIAVLEMLNRSQTPSRGPLKDTFDTISNIPRYFNVILIILGCLIVFWIAKQIKDFIAPNCSCLPSCVCNRQPDRTGSRQSGRQNPDTLARCGSQISLVVHNDRDQLPLTTLSPAGHARYVPLHPHPEEGEYSMITET